MTQYILVLSAADTLSDDLANSVLVGQGQVRRLAAGTILASIASPTRPSRTLPSTSTASPAISASTASAANRRKRLLICDMDSTIIPVECIDEIADFAGVKDRVSDMTERAMRGELDFEEALRVR